MIGNSVGKRKQQALSMEKGMHLDWRGAGVLAWLMASPIGGGASAQSAIALGRTAPISLDARAYPHAESYLAVNPRNPANLLASALTIRRDGFGSVAYASFDGGVTWRASLLTGTASSVTTGGDAIVYFDGDGTAFFGSNDRDGLWVARSRDGGQTFDTATLLPGPRGFDRQFMGFDGIGRFKGRIYAGASALVRPIDGEDHSMLAIATSVDGGASFGQAYTISASRDESPFVMTGIHVTPDGTVLVPFSSQVRGTDKDSLVEWRFRVATSVNGGQSYLVGPIGLSTRRPASVSVDKFGAGFATALDESETTTRGRLYVAWFDWVGDGGEIRVSWTDDQGRTWSNPVTVTDAPKPGNHANVAIAVNRRGVVALTWNDRRAHRDSCYDLYVAASTDGGESFTPNAKVSSAPTCASTPGPNWTVAPRVADYPTKAGAREITRHGLNVLTVATRWPSGGDTQGLAATPDGTFHAAWIDGSSGVMQLVHTPFTVQPNPGEAISDLRDVGVELKLDVEHCGFDWEAKTFWCDFYLTNRSPEPVRGPFTIILKRWSTNLVDVEAAASDNGVTKLGASWTFVLQPSVPSLAPTRRTPVRRITWRFRVVPSEPTYPFFEFEIKARAPR